MERYLRKDYLLFRNQQVRHVHLILIVLQDGDDSEEAKDKEAKDEGAKDEGAKDEEAKDEEAKDDEVSDGFQSETKTRDQETKISESEGNDTPSDSHFFLQLRSLRARRRNSKTSPMPLNKRSQIQKQMSRL